MPLPANTEKAMDSINGAVGQDAPLPVLTREVRRLDDLIRETMRNALGIAMDEGDLLARIKARVGKNWINWRAEHLPGIPKATDELYRRLAAHRALIEQELEVNPDLSIRGARRLISAPKPPKAPKPPALEQWGALDAAAKTAGLEHDGFDKFLEYMPPTWREALTDRISALAGKPTTTVGTDNTLVLAKGALALLENKSPDNIENARRKLSSIINQYKTAAAEEPASTVH
jgi:hypothetical protein